MKMKPITLNQIAAITGGKLIGGNGDELITGVVRDNREVERGNLFVCFTGEKADGHDFAADAAGRGAACCLCEREPDKRDIAHILVPSTAKAICQIAEYYRSLFDIPIIGITGSVGKTTTKEMTAAVLGAHFSVLKTEGNLNNELGVPLTLLRMREEHTAAVIEMGISDFGEMHRLSKMVRPTACIMTKIAHSHLEQLGDLDGVLKAKSEIFDFMQPRSTAIVCGDDIRLAALESGTEKLTYGEESGNDFVAEDVSDSITEGVSCRIKTPDGALNTKIHGYGRHLALAALAAAATAKTLGMTEDEIARGIESYSPIGGRSNVIQTGYITIVDDCYNANPDSVKSAITSLAGVKGRRVAILGDMLELGKNSDELHRSVGICAGENGIDSVICCGNSANHIFSALISTDSRIGHYHFPLKNALFAQLASLIQKGDTVLVKASHGMHFEEIVEELKLLI